ncbi:unknown [[Mannheimia] succiniciproducens MBEL55E]|uniref:Uncharacterized protein n=1 Tax=Mannheimia succiniciproducens (strain KCTC 0769BP / MBEL55E) TaxID=221988 RepID=Q65Q59_MANSM|nr:unknown [[Mannheimia] succiniciproducens MBEL55E]
MTDNNILIFMKNTNIVHFLNKNYFHIFSNNLI